jgi:hypothetical protein
MKKFAKTLLGMNLASFYQLMRSGTGRFVQACDSAYWAAARPSVPSSPIPEISLGEILGDRRPHVNLEVMAYEDGMLPSGQALVLLAILVAEQPSEILEIGTYMGHTTRMMAENLTGSLIHTVDLPESYSGDNDADTGIPKDDFHLIRTRVVGREFKEHACLSNIRQHFADTATWDFRGAGSPAFFFIDGSHTYEYCKNDSEKCFAIAGSPCVFLWHDCDSGHPGVERFVREWRDLGRDVRRIAGTPMAYWKRT